MHKYAAVIIIPCYNESGRLDVSQLSEFAKINTHIRFLIVDDGSTDNTARMLEKASFDVVRNKKNLGKAESVRYGVAIASELDCDYIGFWDADLATPLKDINIFIDLMRSNPSLDIVTGARIKRLGCDVKRSCMRHYLGRVFATFVSMKLQLPVYDTQCGAKLFKKETFRSLCRERFNTKWFFDVELLMRYIAIEGRAKALDSILEHPVSSWCDRGNSKVRLSAAFTQFIKLMGTSKN